MKTQLQPYAFFVSLLIASAFTTLQLDQDQVPQEAWVEQVFQSLSEEQRIGQLFLVAAHSDKGEKHYRVIEERIQRYNIGGLLFLQGTATRQVQLTNRYQQAASAFHRPDRPGSSVQQHERSIGSYIP